MKNTKENKLSLIKLTVPIFIELLLFMTLGFVDVKVLSKYNEFAGAAVGAANQIISIFAILFSVISAATAILVAQNIGAGRRKEVSKITAISIVFNLFIGGICSILVLAFSEKLLGWVGVQGEMLSFANEYLKIVGSFLVVQAILNTLAAVIRSHGNTAASTKVTGVMNIMNISLDLIFVLGLFGMPVLGIKGVAIATSASRVLGLILMLVLLFRNYENRDLFKYLKETKLEDIIKIVKIGGPSALESGNYNISQIVITNIILVNLGSLDFATKTFVSNIVMFFFIFAIAVGQGNQILIGHLVGEKKFDKAHETCMKSLKVAMALCLTMSFIGIIFRYKLIGMYTDNQYIIALGATILLLDIFVEFGRCFNLVIINGLRGAGDTIFPVVMAVISMWGTSTLGAYVLGVKFGLGLLGVWIAFAADEIIRGICMLIRWKSGKWRNKSFV